MTETHIEARDDLGQPIGKIPVDMGREGLLAAGFTETSPLKAIRANCVDCMCGSERLVRECAASKCPLWPFRMAKNPWHGLAGKAGAPLSQERLEAMAQGRKKARLPCETRVFAEA